jgi:acetyl esterase
MRSELHPEAKALREEIGALQIPPAHAQSPEGSRRASNQLFIEWESDVPTREVAETKELLIEGPDDPVPVRAYLPDADGPLPSLVHLHGGGWVRGEVGTYDEFCKHLTDELDCLTFSVDYRRAPEHPFPAAVEDSYAATKWVAENADLFGGDSRLAVIGDSAGGNLTAAVTLMARNQDGPDIDHQVLIYPATNHAFDTDSYEENANAPELSRAAMEWYWDHYLERELDGRHPCASPLQARRLSELPPATLITAGHDPLRDEGKAYAERLEAAGVDVNYTNYDDMMHVFNLFPELSRAQEARESIVEDLQEAFGGS